MGPFLSRFLKSQIADFADFFFELKPIFGQKELATLIWGEGAQHNFHDGDRIKGHRKKRR